MTFMLIPAGSFVKGSPPDEEGRSDSKEEQKRVNISEPFYLGQTEVTEAQFATLYGKEYLCSTTPHSVPVTNIYWCDAVCYCRLLTQWAHDRGIFLGWKFLLPTGNQWEYACRAGSTTRFSSGEGLGDLERVAWTSGAVRDVAQKEPNAWGLYDMHGNVAEWYSDSFSKYRGGHVGSEIAAFRAAATDYKFFDHTKDPCIGFRIALVRDGGSFPPVESPTSSPNDVTATRENLPQKKHFHPYKTKR